jgi:hypothetical protein
MAATVSAVKVEKGIARSANSDGGGCLLLSIGQGVVFSLNGSALLVWSELEQSDRGMSVEDMVDFLAKTYEGSGVGRDVFSEDISRLMEDLRQKGFVRLESRSVDGGIYVVQEDVFRATDNDSRGVSSTSEFVPGLVYKPMDDLARGAFRATADVCLGWVALVSYDVLLKVRGFGKVCELVERRSVGRRKEWSFDRVREICAGVDRARLWYPKNVVCLQHSAVVTWLLRRAGVPARMVFAGRRVPFYAHAWCEVRGIVVNDRQSVRNRYSLFRRCRRVAGLGL